VRSRALLSRSAKKLNSPRLPSPGLTDRKSRRLDPRLSHLDWLERFSGEISEIISRLRQKTSDEDRETAAGNWTDKYEMQREGIVQQITDIQAKQYLGANVIISAAVIVLTVFLESGSTSIWALITGAPK
jgi:hypothetical protein